MGGYFVDRDRWSYLRCRGMLTLVDPRADSVPEVCIRDKKLSKVT